MIRFSVRKKKEDRLLGCLLNKRFTIRHGKEVKWLWFRNVKVKVCITGRALALPSVSVTKGREEEEGVLELLRRQERQCEGGSPEQWARG